MAKSWMSGLLHTPRIATYVYHQPMLYNSLTSALVFTINIAISTISTITAWVTITSDWIIISATSTIFVNVSQQSARKIWESNQHIANVHAGSWENTWNTKSHKPFENWKRNRCIHNTFLSYAQSSYVRSTVVWLSFLAEFFWHGPWPWDVFSGQLGTTVMLRPWSKFLALKVDRVIPI